VRGPGVGIAKGPEEERLDGRSKGAKQDDVKEIHTRPLYLFSDGQLHQRECGEYTGRLILVEQRGEGQ